MDVELTDTEKAVYLYWKANKSYVEIGKILQLSVNRVSRMHSKATRKLREAER